MLKSSIVGFVIGVLSLGSFATPVFGTNRFYIDNRSVPIGSTGVEIPILANMDQDTYGFSISLQYDAAKIRVASVALGAASSALAPEYDEGFIKTDVSPARVVHGVVFDLSNPVTKKLSPGTARELLVLTVDVLATTAGTSVLDLINVQGNPARLNVMTNGSGESVTPAPQLGDGTLTLTSTPPLPVIDSIINNSGSAGKQFIVVGQNFTVAGFRILVCGTQATVNLLADNQTAQVIAPACGASGWAVVEVCTNSGCDSEAQGFNYEITGTLFIRGDANNDGGADISDAVAILNDLFLGIPSPAPCRDSLDTNDSGVVDLSDGVYLLVYLFQGGADIPPPAVVPGVDPTADAIPPC